METSSVSIPEGEGSPLLLRSHTDPMPSGFPSSRKPNLQLQTLASGLAPRANGGPHLWEDEGSTSSSGSSRSGNCGGSGSGKSRSCSILAGGGGGHYTSMRDLIYPNKPFLSLSPINCSDDIPISNPLVKQAAYAYLLPKESPRPEPSRCWLWRLPRNHSFIGTGVGCGGLGDHDRRSPTTGCVSFISCVVDAMVDIFRRRGTRRHAIGKAPDASATADAVTTATAPNGILR